jgi:hypothetical protein
VALSAASHIYHPSIILGELKKEDSRDKEKRILTKNKPPSHTLFFYHCEGAFLEVLSSRLCVGIWDVAVHCGETSRGGALLHQPPFPT